MIPAIPNSWHIKQPDACNYYSRARGGPGARVGLPWLMVTALGNGRLWGWRARDWADIQEGQMWAAYRTILAKLALEPGQSLLDVGCGAGMFASMASERRLLVSGIDASDALIAIARERTPGADFRVGDIEDL